MSYVRKGNEFAGYGGIGSTANVNLTSGDDGVRIIQTQLQRIGFLAPGTGPTGVDGKWGVRTEAAMRAAAQYVGYTGTPYTLSGNTITVPDDLMGLLQNAPPLTPQQVQTITGSSTPGGMISTTTDTTSTTDTSLVTTPITNGAAAGSSPFPWLTVLLVGGGVVGIAAVAYWANTKRKYPLTVPTAKSKPASTVAMAHHHRYSRHPARKAREIIRVY
jgi:peptidoglycan hydrolase-like protein with peptidoglycan-binding domain